MKQQLSVYATYSDGSTRDVTAEAFIESSNIETANPDRAATVTPRPSHRQEVAVMPFPKLEARKFASIRELNGISARTMEEHYELYK